MCRFKRYVSVLCDMCKKGLNSVDKSYCMYCGFGKNIERCGQCRENNRQHKHVALYRYSDTMKEYIRPYKFSYGYHLRHIFHNEIKQAIKVLGNPIVVPIPVSKHVDSKMLFDHVNGLLDGIPSVSLLACKSKESAGQKFRDRRQRLSSKQPFYILDDFSKISLETKICVFDDIYTTGQTINHAIECLKAQGFKDICSLSLAR